MPTIKLDAHPEDYLETSHKTYYFRKVKFMLTIVDIVIAIMLAVIVSIIYGFQVKPFYLPLDVVLFAMGLVAFMVFIKSTAFKFYELKHAETSSSKLIIAKRMISWSFTVLVITLVLCLIFVPYTTPALKNVTSAKWEGEMKANETMMNVTFSNRDYLGTVVVKDIEVKLITGPSVQFSVYYSGSSTGGLPAELKLAGTSVTMPVQYMDGYKEFIITFTKNVKENAKVSYTLKAQLSQLYSVYDLPLALSFVIASIPITIYCEMQKKKYIKGSIYEHL